MAKSEYRSYTEKVFRRLGIKGLSSGPIAAIPDLEDTCTNPHVIVSVQPQEDDF